jgi:hypothetical protein
MPSHESLAISAAAKDLYERKLRSQLEASHLHEFVAVEPYSGDYFLGDTLSAAIQAARVAHPARISFTLRIGHDTGVHLGELST